MIIMMYRYMRVLMLLLFLNSFKMMGYYTEATRGTRRRMGEGGEGEKAKTTCPTTTLDSHSMMRCIPISQHKKIVIIGERKRTTTQHSCNLAMNNSIGSNKKGKKIK